MVVPLKLSELKCVEDPKQVANLDQLALEMIDEQRPSVGSYGNPSLLGRQRAFTAAANDVEGHAGILTVTHMGDWFQINHLWVLPALRRDGVGRQLVKKMEDFALALGVINGVHQDVMGYEAPDFYKKLGYTETHRIEGYFNDYDRIYFEKVLTPS